MHGVVLLPRKSFTRLTNGARLAKPSCWRRPYELLEVFGAPTMRCLKRKMVGRLLPRWLQLRKFRNRPGAMTYPAFVQHSFRVLLA